MKNIIQKFKEYPRWKKGVVLLNILMFAGTLLGMVWLATQVPDQYQPDIVVPVN